MYSPPAAGHMRPSCAYDSAPAKARHPPITHSARMTLASGTFFAMNAGTVKMPAPITLDTISATPSRALKDRRSWLAMAGAVALAALLPMEGPARLARFDWLWPGVFED